MASRILVGCKRAIYYVVRGYSSKEAALNRRKVSLNSYKVGFKYDLENQMLKDGVREVQSQMSQGQFAGDLPTSFVGAGILDKLKNDPRTKMFFNDPSYLKLVSNLQQNPHNMSTQSKDPRVMTTVDVLMEFNISGSAGGADDAVDMDSQPALKPESSTPKEEPIEVELSRGKEQFLYVTLLAVVTVLVIIHHKIKVKSSGLIVSPAMSGSSYTKEHEISDEISCEKKILNEPQSIIKVEKTDFFDELCVNAAAIEDEEIWLLYKIKFQKAYSAHEDQERSIIFRNNLEKIIRHNFEFQHGEHSFKLGINKFSDWTRKEYLDMLGVVPDVI